MSNTQAPLESLMDKAYDPSAIEKQWYDYWDKNGLFAPITDAAQTGAYCIMLPPPNVTGTLHMGHGFQQTIMDILIRYHRMKGDPTLWQVGTDHAGIATQMVVERQLNLQGQTRHELGREVFLDKVWEWKNYSGGTITKQMRRLGTSPDWSRERFTMDEGLSQAVQTTFIRLFEQGLIYRGKRLVNWDPILKTAVSDLEVLSEEEQGSLWHLRYPLTDGTGHLVVATTRPETMLGDMAVAVHPDDPRYAHLIGKTIQLPLCDRPIPIIGDDYVDPEFGSGCVKITPAHDFNDYEMGKRHQLTPLNIFNPDASLNESVPEAYHGLDRFVARKQIVADLEALGLLDKIEPHTLKIPRCDRTNQIVEPYLTDQWFVDAKTLAQPAIAAVTEGKVRFVPENWEKTYFQWMNNIQEWCISRQLWWGHRIPAWYDEAGNIYVGKDEAAIRQQHDLSAEVVLTQDPDVLDTWFSSALWPFSTLGWPQQTDALNTFYPTSVLVTGHDIIFFWVARMIMMGMHFMGDVPFKEVYITGLVRDSEGQKMSKSKGNVLDPIDLIDGIDLEALVEKRTTGLMQPQLAPKIEKSTRQHFPEGIKAYGTDALRFTFAALATNGRDINFDLGRVEGYRNFCNKLWNAARYVLSNQSPDDAVDINELNTELKYSLPDRWIQSRLNATIIDVERYLNEYRFDLAAQTLYEFVWNHFCDWYLELSKPTLTGQASIAEKRGTRLTLIQTLESILKLLHPFMPFITEEIWQKQQGLHRDQITSISQVAWPVAGLQDVEVEAEVAWIQQVLLEIRRIRAEMNIAPSKPLPVLYSEGSALDQVRIDSNKLFLMSLGRLSSLDGLSTVAPESAMALVGSLRLLIPLAGLIDKTQEMKRLDKEIERLAGEVDRLQAKLHNPAFADKAPAAVVDKERAKCQNVQDQLAQMQQQRLKIASL